VSSTCRLCGGAVEGTVLSGVVSLKRRRSMMASGRVSAVRAETCTACGHTELFAERPERLFPEVAREG
jgi:hypothetical protein